MRNKTKIALCLFLASVGATALFAGCSGEMSAEEFLEGKNATDQIVTYYANGGTFDGTGNVVEKEIHYVADSFVIGDFDGVQNISVAKKENSFGGWYFVQTDADGKPVKDSEGNIVKTDTPVDFTVKIKQGEHWYVYAEWIPDVKVTVKLVTSDGGNMHDKSGNEYKPDSEIAYRNFDQGVVRPSLNAPLESKDYTFTQYFLDKECKIPMLSGIPFPEGEKPENPVIYARYIKGDWKIVSDSRGVRDMLTNLASGNYYLCNLVENKTIDCSSISPVLKRGEISATVEGNGFTLTNLTYTVTNLALQEGSTYSVLGQISESASIRNLTFDGVSVSVNTSRNISLYLLTAGAADGAVFENVAFKNVSLSVTTSGSVYNIPQIGDEYDAGNWLFGGVATDKEFLDKFKGLTVESGKLTVNGKEYSYSAE